MNVAKETSYIIFRAYHYSLLSLYIGEYSECDVASTAVTGMWTRVQAIDCHAGRLSGVMCHV